MRIDSSKNQISLVISKNELNTKFNEIKKIVNKSVKNPNFVLVITCDSESKNGAAPYVYQADEVEKLLCINQMFEKNGYSNRILFTEGINLLSVNANNRKISCWTLPIVLEINRKIDRIVQKIKDLRLTPYETILYLHYLASTIQYSNNFPANTLGRESEATLLGLSEQYKHLCCVGYTSFVKVIVEKLQTSDIVVDVNQFQIFQTMKKTTDNDFVVAHATNIVYINDPLYGIKGVYFEDPTPFTGSQTDFSACLVPIPDLRHYKCRVYRQFKLNSQVDSVHQSINVDGKKLCNFNGEAEKYRDIILKAYYESLPFQDPKTHKFTADLKYSSYPLSSFKDAYMALLNKLNESNIDEKLKQTTDFAIARAGKLFDKNAENCFAKEYFKSFKQDIHENNKDILPF